MSTEPPLPGLEPFTVRYPAASLQKLLELEGLTHVTGREWCRVLLEALLERFDLKGAVELPIAVVSRAEAVRCGLLEPRQ